MIVSQLIGDLGIKKNTYKRVFSKDKSKRMGDLDEVYFRSYLWAAAASMNQTPIVSRLALAWAVWQENGTISND